MQVYSREPLILQLLVQLQEKYVTLPSITVNAILVSMGDPAKVE